MVEAEILNDNPNLIGSYTVFILKDECRMSIG
jgi:hypothetical protein